MPFVANPVARTEAIDLGSAEEVQEKVADYLTAGTRMVWLVYPRSKVIVVDTTEGVRTFSVGDVLDGGDVLPGFQVAVADIFAD